MINEPTNFSNLEHTIVHNNHIHDSLTGERHEWRWCGQLHSFEDHPSQRAIDKHGDIIIERWHHQGLRHRDDDLGPAIARYSEEVYSYHKMGMLHRKNGPAIITKNTRKYYWLGQIHREDGPAIEKADGHNGWAWHGTLHPNFQTWGERSGVDPETFILLKLQYG
jgi:hypothetical protein